MRKLKVLFGILLLTFLSVAAVSTPAQAATRLGGVSVAGACFNQWPGSEVALTSNNVFGWKCRFWGSQGPLYFGINLTQQCGVQYGGGAYAAYSNYNNPYSWSCYR
jgi:hypothetical protein